MLSIQKRKEVIWEAISWKKTPYVWGGNSKYGIDCSHFVWQVYHKIVSSRIPVHFFTSGSNDHLFFNRVSKNEVKKGDVIVWGSQHVGIVVEPDPGTFIGAQCSTGVAGAYYSKGYWSGVPGMYFLSYKF